MIFIFFQKVLPKHFLSRLLGRLAHSRCRVFKNWTIKIFIKYFEIDLSEAVVTEIDHFPSFNDFFIRKLKPEVRPIPNDPKIIAAPADGIISQMGQIQKGNLLQAKNHLYSLEELLGGDIETSRLFQNGQFCTIYLSPKDYHRVHMPISGKLEKMIYVPGKLFSVNHKSVKGIPRLFNQNERVICLFETAAGPMTMIFVGAMLVGGIVTQWSGKVLPAKVSFPVEQANTLVFLNQGEEAGFFQWGSTVILLFGEQQIEWRADLNSGARIKVGERIGLLNNL
ncbi:MAG: phosphatidylserine decarboxylase [Proteobacteria bacterium]|nr:phosphatidylserine decarboxylase [Pseudomonadota bacterium]